jgi:FkbM family methyltransferase
VALASGEHGPFEGFEHDGVVFGAYRRTGTWSPDLVALIAERLFAGAGGTLIDVGANIGLVAIPVLERSAASCVAFEPEPRNHQLLCRNLERHGLQPRVQTHALALDAHNGTVALALCADNSGDHRLVHAQAPEGWPCIGVRAARLDDLLEGRTLERPIVMKLDCQGAEARVLRGAARTLEQVDHLVVEYWPAGLLRMGDSAQALQELLLAFPHAVLLGYQSLEGRLRATATLFAQLAWIPTDGSDEGFFDLLLSRHEELAGPVQRARQPR